MAMSPELMDEAIADRLAKGCIAALDTLVLDPSVEILGIDVEMSQSSRFDSEARSLFFLVRVSTSDASMVRGDISPFKGSYKERLEAVVDRIARELDPNARAFINIHGPETESVDRLVPIQDFIRRKKLSPKAPIIKAAEQNGIDYIQIRGRHLIAPSPAIAEFLERYASQNRENIRRALDLFAGTAIATRVLLRSADPERIVIVENDPQKTLRIKESIHDPRAEILNWDAFDFAIVDEYDLAVADPYYEDVQAFLERQAESLRKKVRVLILVPGNVEDQLWNSNVRRVLESHGFDVHHHERYGQVIFEAAPRGNSHKFLNLG